MTDKNMMQCLHVSYDFIDNGSDELMIVMDAPDYETQADDENAKFVYDGSAEAMIIRNSKQIVHLPVLAEAVRDMLSKIEIILVTEMNGEAIHDVYEAQVEVLNSPLLIPKSAYENLFSAEDISMTLWNQTCPSGSLEVLKTLLEKGANPNQTYFDGEFEWAPLANCLLPDIIDDANWQPFDASQIEKAKILLEYGADPNIVNRSMPDYPPLMLAITYGDATDDDVETGRAPSLPALPELIELLLKKGADPNFTDSEGKTPLSLSVEKGFATIEEILLRYGAKMPEPIDWEDWTEIAEKLDKRYPNVGIDALSLSNDDLKQMIVSLPGFTGDKNAPDADWHRKFIRNEWISIRMPETFHVPDSAYI